MILQQTKKKNKLIDNIIYAFFAQGVSLLLSVVMSLIVPKVLGVEQFGYWQLFIFYAGYVGFFHFGLNDGIYLKLGGSDYDDLDYSLLGSQFRISIIVESIFSFIIVLLITYNITDMNRGIVFVFTGLYLVVSNATLLLGYIFQATNQTKLFSISVVIDRFFVLIFVTLLMVLKIKRFEIFVISYITSKCISFIYCIKKGKKIVFSKGAPTDLVIKEMWGNIAVGINLTFANIASMLILGSGRMVIDKIWGIETFGKLSLSISIANFFLLFISQVSMVLFPFLRQVSNSRLSELYIDVSRILDVVMPIIFLLYFPIKVLLAMWLPQYSESIQYLGLLLPLCIFDGKMQLLCNTYFKVLRKERKILQYNVIAFLFSLIFSLLCGYILHNMYFIVITMIAAIGLRSIISQNYIAGYFDQRITWEIIQEVCLIILFMIISWYCSNVTGFFLYLLIYGIYILLNLKMEKQLLKKVKEYSGK